MQYEWDERKRKANLRKHGFDFQDARTVFDSRALTLYDDRGNYDEERFLTFGLLRGTVVVIVHTERDDRIRIISMRKATPHEAKDYFAEIADGLEADSGNEG